MMLVGVNLFYFIVSNINNIIHNKLEKIDKSEQKMLTLFFFMKKYEIPKELIKKAEHAVISNSLSIDDLKNFVGCFKKSLSVQLSFYLYNSIFKNFTFFMPLKKNILATIGKTLTKTIYSSGILLYV